MEEVEILCSLTVDQSCWIGKILHSIAWPLCDKIIHSCYTHIKVQHTKRSVFHFCDPFIGSLGAVESPISQN